MNQYYIHTYVRETHVNAWDALYEKISKLSISMKGLRSSNIVSWRKTRGNEILSTYYLFHPIPKNAKYVYFVFYMQAWYFFTFFTFVQHCFRNVAHEKKFQDLLDFYAYISHCFLYHEFLNASRDDCGDERMCFAKETSTALLRGIRSRLGPR